MSAVRAFTNANKFLHERDWDTLYVLLDIHGTVMIPNWDGVSTEFYPHCLDVLRHISKDPIYKIIMWTCSKEDDRNHYKKILEDEGVTIDYVNENPEVIGKLNWGDYDSKLYTNVGLDDKFGFCPDTEWLELKEYFGVGPKHFWSLEDGVKWTCDHPNNRGLYKKEGWFVLDSLKYLLEHPDKFTTVDPKIVVDES